MNLLQRVATIREVDNRAKDAQFVRAMEAEIAALREEVKSLRQQIQRHAMERLYP